jgi:hypothetical protein
MPTFYRAVDTNSPEPLQVPQRFALRIPSYPVMAGSENPIQMAVIQCLIEKQADPQSRGWSLKAMIEFAFEVTRLTVSPDLPSRLASLFAFSDLDAAVAFAEQHDHIKAVFAGDLENPGSRISVHDYDRYTVAGNVSVNPTSFGEVWHKACRSARSYWEASTPLTRPETLIAGNLILESSPAWTVTTS